MCVNVLKVNCARLAKMMLEAACKGFTHSASKSVFVHSEECQSTAAIYWQYGVRTADQLDRPRCTAVLA